MNSKELADHARRIINNTRTNGPAMLGEAKELIRNYAGPDNSFLIFLNKVQPDWPDEDIVGDTQKIMKGFINQVENGLLRGITIERQAQIDVVSDFLEQAQRLLETAGVHPAAPCAIIGAALEEFLRNWVEEQVLPLNGQKPSIDAYAKALRGADLITKQDKKDIDSWGGRRNHAAHGEWDEVGGKQTVSMMLEGVNLFMRKYGPQ